MSEQTSERERLLQRLLIIASLESVSDKIGNEMAGIVSDLIESDKADATLHSQLGEAQTEIAALRKRVEACDNQLSEARATIDALRGRCRAAEAYALSLAEKVDEMEAHSEALAHSTPAPVVTEGKGE